MHANMNIHTHTHIHIHMSIYFRVSAYVCNLFYNPLQYIHKGDLVLKGKIRNIIVCENF